MEKATERGARIDVPTVAPAAVSATVTDNSAPTEASPNGESTSEISGASSDNGRQGQTDTVSEGFSFGQVENRQETDRRAEVLKAADAKELIESNTSKTGADLDGVDAAYWLANKAKSPIIKQLFQRISNVLPERGVIPMFVTKVAR